MELPSWSTATHQLACEVDKVFQGLSLETPEASFFVGAEIATMIVPATGRAKGHLLAKGWVSTPGGMSKSHPFDKSRDTVLVEDGKPFPTWPPRN